MGTEDGAHAHGIAGTLELDRTIDTIGVGAHQRAESPTGCRLSQHLGAGDAESEGEVGVAV
jgi:hypothetical protein